MLSLSGAVSVLRGCICVHVCLAAAWDYMLLPRASVEVVEHSGDEDAGDSSDVEGGSGDDSGNDQRATNSPLHPPPPPEAFMSGNGSLTHAHMMDEFDSQEGATSRGDAGAHDYRDGGDDDDDDDDYEDEEEDAEELDGDGADDSLEYRREASDDGGDLDDEDAVHGHDDGGGGADGSDEVHFWKLFLCVCCCNEHKRDTCIIMFACPRMM